MSLTDREREGTTDKVIQSILDDLAYVRAKLAATPKTLKVPKPGDPVKFQEVINPIYCTLTMLYHSFKMEWLKRFNSEMLPDTTTTSSSW